MKGRKLEMSRKYRAGCLLGSCMLAEVVCLLALETEAVKHIYR